MDVVYLVAHDVRADASGPHLASLRQSEGAISFNHAFAQAPYCAPSRASFFTGRRPSVTRVHTFSHEDRSRLMPLSESDSSSSSADAGDSSSDSSSDRGGSSSSSSSGGGGVTWTALPRAFALAGYATHGIGITLTTEVESAQLGSAVWTDGYTNVAAEVKRSNRTDALGKLFTGEGVFDRLVAEAAVDWLTWRRLGRRRLGGRRLAESLGVAPGEARTAHEAEAVADDVAHDQSRGRAVKAQPLSSPPPAESQTPRLFLMAGFWAGQYTRRGSQPAGLAPCRLAPLLPALAAPSHLAPLLPALAAPCARCSLRSLLLALTRPLLEMPVWTAGPTRRARTTYRASTCPTCPRSPPSWCGASPSRLAPSPRPSR